MRLTELTPSHAKSLRKRKTVKDWELIFDWLQKNGYKRIGSGVFGAVFTSEQKESNIVIKLAKDPCYSKYLEFCRKHRSDPYFPKVSPPHKIKVTDEEAAAREKYVTIVFLEKLITLKDAYRANSISQNEYDLYYKIGYAFKNRNENFLQDEERDTEIYKAIDKIKTAFQGICSIDTHDENIMFRPSTKTPVITDPVSHLLTDNEEWEKLHQQWRENPKMDFPTRPKMNIDKVKI